MFPDPACRTLYAVTADTFTPWAGSSVMFRHRPDGSVVATSQGAAAGWDERDALRRLDDLLNPPPELDPRLPPTVLADGQDGPAGTVARADFGFS